MKRNLTLLMFILACTSTLIAQRTGVIQGTIKDKATQEPLIGVSITAEGTNPLIGASSDIDGNFILTVPVGSYNIKASYVGYKSFTKFNISATTGNASIINFELDADIASLGEVVVTENKSIRVATVESPNSIQRLGMEEIKTTPGGNFDIFKVVQTLPGIGSTPNGFNRNDIIVRGGAPGENVYYLDGVEIPVINHFATQGSGGGSNGILNVSFIEELTLSSSSFDARYDNALASVFQFKQRDGNPNRFQGNMRLSSSELAVTAEGPLSKNTTYLASARRSYLQFFFKAIDLAIRPDYWDFQYKVTHKINSKTTLTAIGLGAIDKFYSDLTANTTPNNAQVIKQAPYIRQWNYTVGLSLRRLMKNGFMNIALSRNMADNEFSQYEDGLRDDESKRYLFSSSREAENKLRLDVNKYLGSWKLSYGGVAQYVKYNNDFYNIFRKEIKDSNGLIVQPEDKITFNTGVDFLRYGLFAQASHLFMGDRLGLNIGVRSDMNNFTSTGGNPLKTLSPRASLSYRISNKWKANASFGNYYKLPSYTILGYRDRAGVLVNKSADYIRSTHYVAGLEFIPRVSTRFTLEGFYKEYDNYPVSLRSGISLANEGQNFGFIGNEAISSTGKGKAYGAEFFFQQKLTKNLFAIVSYTYVISRFSGADGKLIASAWDNRHLLSTQLGRKFKRGWEMGLKYRITGGVPYTPYDLVVSQRVYPQTGQGVLDYSRLNGERLKPFQQFDFRIDKKWNLKNSTFDLYFDVSNALLARNQQYPSYVFERLPDNTGFKTTDGKSLKADGSNGIPVVEIQDDPVVIPSLGFMFEF